MNFCILIFCCYSRIYLLFSRIKKIINLKIYVVSQ